MKKTGSGRKIRFLISNLFCSLIYSIKQQTITDELGKPFSQRRCRAWFEHYAGILMVQDCFIIFYIHLEVYIQMNNLSHSDSLLGHWAFCFVLSSAHTKIQFQPLTNVMFLILWSRSYWVLNQIHVIHSCCIIKYMCFCDFQYRGRPNLLKKKLHILDWWIHGLVWMPLDLTSNLQIKGIFKWWYTWDRTHQWHAKTN